MTEIIGRGKDKLISKIKACKKAGGSIVIRTGFSGKQYTSKVIAACYGKGDEVKGGTIGGLDPSIVSSLREKQKGDKELSTKDALDILS